MLSPSRTWDTIPSSQLGLLAITTAGQGVGSWRQGLGILSDVVDHLVEVVLGSDQSIEVVGLPELGSGPRFARVDLASGVAFPRVYDLRELV